MKINGVERYIDKYLPIRIQSQLSEALHSVGSDKMIELLKEYEFTTFAGLNNNIVSDTQNTESPINEDMKQ